MRPKMSLWIPKVQSAISIDATDGRVYRQLRTTDPQFGLATGVVEHDGKLWLGCIGASAIASIDL